MENLFIYDTLLEKKRIGRANDGGYVVLMLPGTYDIILSGGISNDISFEQDILNHYPNLYQPQITINLYINFIRLIE